MARPNGSVMFGGRAESALARVAPVIPPSQAIQAFRSRLCDLAFNLVSRAARSKGCDIRLNPEENELADPWPTEIRLSKDRRTLTVTFDTAEAYALSAEYLRVFSPSAEVQGHSPEQRQTVGGKAAVEILKVEPIGNYAVRLQFDDLHNTGIFTWSYLRKLGREHAALWDGYLGELAEKGLSREGRHK
jgi:DUF971 family protein